MALVDNMARTDSDLFVERLKNSPFIFSARVVKLFEVAD